MTVSTAFAEFLAYLVAGFPLGMIEGWRPRLYYAGLAAVCLAIAAVAIATDTPLASGEPLAKQIAGIVGTVVGIQAGKYTYRREFDDEGI